MTARVPVSEQIYRALLHLYPGAFRDRFGDEMVQLFGDLLRDARAGRSGGVVGTWLRTIGDLVATAPLEHLRRDRTVARSLAAPTTATRALGIIGILGGLFLVIALVPGLPWSAAVFNLRLAFFNAGAITVAVALLRRRDDGSRVLASGAAAVVILANAWYLVMTLLFIGRPQPPEPDPEFRPLYFYAAVALWVADAIYGLVALRIGVVSRLASLALAVGALLALTGVGGLGFTSGPLAGIIEPLTTVGIVLVGLGWIGLGLDVATRHRAKETT
jgi:hypothetical protein